MFLALILLSALIAPAAAQLKVEVGVGSHHKLVECRHGTFLINKKDTWIGRSLEVYGDWAQSEIELIAGFIDEGDTVVDVGANIGSFTVPMAKMVGASGKVVSFEAQRVLSHLLSANLALNELTNVGVYNAGVGSTADPLEVPDVVYAEEANFGSISLLFDWKARGASTSLIPQMRLDDVFAGQCPSFIKVDVEGMELLVLNGAEHTIRTCNPVIFVENNCKKESKELIQFVADLGYVCHWHVDQYFSKANFRMSDVNIFPEDANSINMLCYSVNNPASVERAKTLPAITRIDVLGGRYLLNDYNLRYTGGEGAVRGNVLSQMGTLESCGR